MSSESVTTQARLRFQAETNNNGCWGPECTVGQMRKQTNDVVREMSDRIIAACAKDGIRIQFVEVESVKVIL